MMCDKRRCSTSLRHLDTITKCTGQTAVARLIDAVYTFNMCKRKFYSVHVRISALTLLVGRQEGHPACKKTGCWFVGGDDLTGALRVL